MRITYSKHAQLKLEERRIKAEVIEEVLEKPDLLFYDIMSKTIIAVAKVKFSDIETNLVVVFTKDGENIKIVTVYPCKDIDKEIRRKEGSRWVKI